MIKLAVSGDPKTNQILLVPENGTGRKKKICSSLLYYFDLKDRTRMVFDLLPELVISAE